jgi:uncharacterized repeat protein (TIGR03803 family)
MRSKEIYSSTKTFIALSVIFLLAMALTTRPADAQTFKVLHTFHGGFHDGSGPYGRLTVDQAGNLYGTTAGGGTGRGGLCNDTNKSDSGCGTVFKMNKNGKLIWLYSFPDFAKKGAGPMAGVLRDKVGNLYGTTIYGGDTKCYSLGCGVVFKVDATGKKGMVLHRFKGGQDGQFPEALLVDDDSGNLYGTTYEGGTWGYGTVFRVNNSGKEWSAPQK